MIFGQIAIINLYECNNYIKNPEKIKLFIKKLVDVIDMKTHGETIIDRFGEGEIEGYSAFQFIKTSSVTFHNDEKYNSAYIDIFSCKEFDYMKATLFCKDFFEAKDFNSQIINR